MSRRLPDHIVAPQPLRNPLCASLSSTGYIRPIRNGQFALASYHAARPVPERCIGITCAAERKRYPPRSTPASPHFRCCSHRFHAGCDGRMQPFNTFAGRRSADGERTILFDALGIMLAIVVPTILATLAFAWWFRASNNAALSAGLGVFRPHRTRRLVDPALTIMLPWRRGLDRLARPRSGAAAASEASRWRCRSSRSTGNGCSSTPTQQVASVNELVMPAGMPVHFPLTSACVMNVSSSRSSAA